MHHFFLLDFDWSQLINPKWYVLNGGIWFILFVVFAETGLFVGFFLPGDSLLFLAGIYAHEIDESHAPGLTHQFLQLIGMGNLRNTWVDLFVLIALISVCGIIGNMLGYWIGRKFGPAMYHWRDRLFFKKRYLYEAHDFYEKYGGGAIVIARFVPIVRTFAPLVAGIVDMNKTKFSFYNVVGCVAWVTSMIFGGFFLQKWMWVQFHFDLKKHLEVIVIGIVLITTAPVLIKLFFGKKKTTVDNKPNP